MVKFTETDAFILIFMLVVIFAIIYDLLIIWQKI